MNVFKTIGLAAKAATAITVYNALPTEVKRGVNRVPRQVAGKAADRAKEIPRHAFAAANGAIMFVAAKKMDHAERVDAKNAAKAEH